MGNLFYLITITTRELGEKFINYFVENNVLTVLSTLCHGTAQQKTLDLLGIEKTEKVMMFSVVPGGSVKSLLRGLLRAMHIDVPGSGIALTVPVRSIGGRRCFNYLTNGQDINIEEVKKMCEPSSYPYELIITICEKGSVDTVMRAARSAGAGGGTVIHAKDTGEVDTKKFFDVSIAAEKEIVYIVTRAEDAQSIMKAIMEEAGMKSDAHGAVMSLPVANVVGLQSLVDTD